jgi:hypothetical protein
MRRVTGVITTVQETRFRLVTDGGRGKLFLLSAGAPLEAQDLEDLQRAQTRVTVHFTDAREMIAGVAHDLTRPGGAP